MPSAVLTKTSRLRSGKAAGTASEPVAPEVSKDEQPRYLQVARDLKRGITDGTYPVGSQLPTELQLCEQFAISRFTARAAVEQLQHSGLITRRKRAGTVVVASPADAKYTHDLSTASDLLQYAHNTELEMMYIGKLALSAEQAKDIGADPGEEWIYAVGLRRTQHDRARPISVARAFINPRFEGIQAKLREVKASIYTIIERDFQCPIARIEQEMQGALLSAQDAGNLGCEPGSAALRIVRRFFSDDGELLEYVENIHPSDRFMYRMQLRK